MNRVVRKMRFGVVALAVLAAALAFPAAPAYAGQGMVTPIDHCIEIIHFPLEPIGNSPSKGRIYSTFKPVYAGGEFTVNLDGASGTVQGEGPIDRLGIGYAEFPLNSYGPHSFTGGSIEMDGTSTPVNVTFFGDGGTFTVDETEPVCNPDDLLLAETSPTTTVPPTTTEPEVTGTTKPPTTTEVPATAQPSVVSDDGFPWMVFIIAGIVLLGIGFLVFFAPGLIALPAGGIAKGGTFTDDRGNAWIYCEARGCRVKQQSITDTEGRRVEVRAEPRRGGCADCKCVLFENVAGAPKLLDEDGGWVTKKAGAEYSARCVRKA